MPPPPPAKATKLTVREGVMPRANVSVLFQAPDGTVIADTTTDAAGVATALMPAGGIVTAVYKQADAHDQVFTYAGVKPGDELVLARPYAARTPRTIAVSVGLDGELVQITTPCGSGAGAGPRIEVDVGECTGAIDFYVETLAAERESFLANAMIADTVDLSTYDGRGALTTQLAASNVPPTMRIALSKRLERDGFAFFTAYGEDKAELAIADVPGAEQVVSAQIVAADGTEVVISLRDTYAALPSTIDIGAALLPTPTNTTLAGDQLTWTEQGSGTPDAVLVEMGVTREPIKFIRSITGPYAGTTFMLPSLPGAYDTYNLTATDTYVLYPTLVKATGGYDAARPRMFAGAPSDAAPKAGQATASRGMPIELRP